MDSHLQIQSGRRVVPTELGITLVRGYQLIDPELCRPNVRAYVEQQIDLIAKARGSGGVWCLGCSKAGERTSTGLGKDSLGIECRKMRGRHHPLMAPKG